MAVNELDTKGIEVLLNKIVESTSGSSGSDSLVSTETVIMFCVNGVMALVIAHLKYVQKKNDEKMDDNAKKAENLETKLADARREIEAGYESRLGEVKDAYEKADTDVKVNARGMFKSVSVEIDEKIKVVNETINRESEHNKEVSKQGDEALQKDIALSNERIDGNKKEIDRENSQRRESFSSSFARIETVAKESREEDSQIRRSLQENNTFTLDKIFSINNNDEKKGKK